MTEQQYAEWTDYHRGLFFMHTDNDTELFRLWRPSLIGYTHAELAAASLWLAENDGGQFRSAHLTSLRRRVATVRVETWRREQAEQMAGVRRGCPTCQDTGLVSVPHKAFVVDDEWQRAGNTKYTGVVTCDCDAGTRKMDAIRRYSDDRQSRGRGPIASMTLAEYEALVPHWRDLVAARHGELIDEIKIEVVAREADRRSPLRKLRLIGAMPTGNGDC